MARPGYLQQLINRAAGVTPALEPPPAVLRRWALLQASPSETAPAAATPRRLPAASPSPRQDADPAAPDPGGSEAARPRAAVRRPGPEIPMAAALQQHEGAALPSPAFAAPPRQSQAVTRPGGSIVAPLAPRIVSAAIARADSPARDDRSAASGIALDRPAPAANLRPGESTPAPVNRSSEQEPWTAVLAPPPPRAAAAPPHRQAAAEEGLHIGVIEIHVSPPPAPPPPPPSRARPPAARPAPLTRPYVSAFGLRQE